MNIDLRNRLLESLLTEKDNRRKIVKVFGVSDAIADWAHSINDKLSIWIVGSAKKKYEAEMDRRSEDDKVPMEEYVGGLTDDYRDIIRLVKIDNKPPMNIKQLSFDEALEYVGRYHHIEAWLDDPINDITAERGVGFLKNMSWDEALRMADEWHASLEAGGEVEDLLDDKDELIHDFGNGFKWYLRKDRRCDSSRKSMGHCATASEQGMWLLRLINGNREFVTVDWNPQKKYTKQIKGKKNKKPIPKLHPFILWLITEWGGIEVLMTDKGYLPKTNFQLGDLEPDVAAKVYADNPKLMDIHTVLKYTPNNKKGEFITHLFKQENFLLNLIPFRFSKFFELVENKDAVNGIVVKHPTFLAQMNEYHGLLAYTLEEMINGSQYKDKLIEALLNKDGLIPMLDEEGAEVLINNHSDPESVRDILFHSEFDDDEFDDEPEDMEENLYLRESLARAFRKKIRQ